MSWEVIDNRTVSKGVAKMPAEGLVIGVRRGIKGSRYITIKIGLALAQRAGFTGEQQQVRLMLGGGRARGQDRAGRGARRAIRRQEGQAVRAVDDHRHGSGGGGAVQPELPDLRRRQGRDRAHATGHEGDHLRGVRRNAGAGR